MTAAEEDRMRRREAMKQAAKVREIYEELVLKKPAPAVVTIGSLDAIKAATPGNGGNGALHSIAPSNGGNGSAKPAEKREPATVEGD
jgi:hypothetical protein